MRSTRLRAGGAGRRDGQILMMTLLALVLLASVVFFVFNSGEQVNRRMTMQNAADSAAIGGATWMARSMNTIAMNNVAQSRLITLLAMVDSLPLASELTYNELSAIVAGLQVQLQDPRMNQPDMEIIRLGIESMLYGREVGDYRHPGLQLQLDRVAPLYQAVCPNGVESPAIMASTFWMPPGASGPGPQGRFWVGAKALEDFNQSIMDSMGILCQVTAVKMGSDCIARERNVELPLSGAAALLVPVKAVLPAKVGEFNDFQKPIYEGIPAERVRGTTSDQFQRGPYDQLFHWRKEIYDTSYARPGETVGTGQQVTIPPKRSAPVGGGNHPSLVKDAPGADMGRTYWTGYRTISYAYPGPQKGWNPYGVYDWALVVRNEWDRYGQLKYPNSGMASYCDEHVPDLPSQLYPAQFSREKATCNFLARMQVMTKAKLDYMFGTRAPGSKTVHRPIWITDYQKAKEYAAANPGKVDYTWLWVLRIRSSLPPTDPNYLKAAGTFYPAANARDYDPYSCAVQPGWLDPNDPANVQKFGQTQQIGPGVWRTDWTYEVEFDVDIGLPVPPATPPPAPGVPVPPPVLHPVYVRDQFVMFGVDVGDELAVRNPANWSAGDVPPRPLKLDLEAANYRSDGARDYFSVLGVARESTSANLWPQQFLSGNPYGNVLGVAEAHVFNNQSWDLWTQHWQARLRPIDDWGYWINTRMANVSPGDFGDVQPYTQLTPEEFARVYDALQKYPADMVNKIKTH